MNKRGTIFDIPNIILYFFLIAMILIMSYVIYVNIQPKLDTGLDNAESTQALAQGKKSLEVLDIGLMILFFGLFISSFVAAFLIRSHPIFAIPLVFTGIIFLFIAALLANIWVDVAAQETINQSVENFTSINWIIGNYPYVLGPIILILILIIVGKYGIGGSNIGFN